MRTSMRTTPRLSGRPASPWRTAPAGRGSSRARALRELEPGDPDELWAWLVGYTGLRLARRPVCAGHTAPFNILANHYFERPPISLTHGPRGGGKSLGAALAVHCTSRWTPGHGAVILGGSEA